MLRANNATGGNAEFPETHIREMFRDTVQECSGKCTV